jgi:hypothetical protein
MTVDERVAAGMAVLDARIPDWVDRIDLDRLDMASGIHEPEGFCGCLLAQVDAKAQPSGVGDYLNLRRRLTGPDDDGFEWAIDHGFTADGEVFEDLTEAWRTAILTRRAAATP